MGRKLESVLQGFVAAKCLTLLNHAIARIKVSRNQKRVLVRQMRGEIAQLLRSGQIAIVYDTKIDSLIRETNIMAAYNLIDQFCHTLVSQFPLVEAQRTCPQELKEPIASLIFAAPRCAQLAELTDIKDMLISKYGKDIATAADEMRQGCGVNTQPASEPTKTKLAKDICLENKIEWRTEWGPEDPIMRATSYHMDTRAPDEISDNGSDVFLSYEEEKDEMFLPHIEPPSRAARMKRGKTPSPSCPKNTTVHDMSSLCPDIPASLELDEEFASRAQVIAAEAARQAVLEYARQYSRSGSTVYTTDSTPKEQFSQGAHKQHFSPSKFKATMNSDVGAGSYLDNMDKAQSSSRIMAVRSHHQEVDVLSKSTNKEEKSPLPNEMPSQHARWNSTSSSKSEQEHHYQEAAEISEKPWNKMPSPSHATIDPTSTGAISRKLPQVRKQDEKDNEGLATHAECSSSLKWASHQQMKHGHQQNAYSATAGFPRPPDIGEETIEPFERSPPSLLGTKGGYGSSYPTKNRAQESSPISKVLAHDNNLIKSNPASSYRVNVQINNPVERPQPQITSKGDNDLAAVYTPPVQIHGMGKRTGPKPCRPQPCEDKQNFQAECPKLAPNMAQQKQRLGHAMMQDTGKNQENHQAMQEKESSSQYNKQQEPLPQKQYARSTLGQQEKHAPEERHMPLPIHNKHLHSRPGKEPQQSDSQHGLRHKEQLFPSDRYKQKDEDDDVSTTPHFPQRKPDMINQQAANQVRFMPQRNTNVIDKQEGQQVAQEQPALLRHKQELGDDVRMDSNLKLNNRNQPPARKPPPLQQKELSMQQHNVIHKEKPHKEEEKPPSRAEPPRRTQITAEEPPRNPSSHKQTSHESSSSSQYSHRRQMSEPEEVQAKPKPARVPRHASSDLTNELPPAGLANPSPKKPPDVDVLAANFENLKRMRNRGVNS